MPRDLGPDASFMAQFDVHFTALFAAASGSNVVQESLAVATITQYSAIISKLEALEALYVAPSSGGGSGGGRGGGGRNRPFTSDDRTKASARINQLQAAIRGSWITSASSKFCLTHGWGLGPCHDSMSCKNNTKEGKPGGHVNASTRANPVGPRRNKTRVGMTS